MFKTPIEEKREAEINRTGAIVREAREKAEAAKAKIAEAESTLNSYRETIIRNKMELETLGDPEKLNSELQKRVIDLNDSNKTYELFIQGVEKELPTLNHAATMASKAVEFANNDFEDAKRIGQDSDGLTSNERAKLQTMSLSQMPFEDKKYWADRVGGIDKLQEIVPLV